MMSQALRRQWVRLKNRVCRSRDNTKPRTGWVEVKRMGFYWRLRADSFIGRMIIENGVFEPHTTKIVRDYVKPGMQVLDIGANIGYYTLLLAHAVGPEGRVWAFEPVTAYREQLEWHLNRNGLAHRVRVVPYGLSDTSVTCPIAIGDTSATLHWCGERPATRTEQITLHRLDDVAGNLGISRVDFIKLDVDGHEPKFLHGASKLLKEFHPPITLEFAQHCLHMAGSDVREQARLLSDLGYVICSEKTGQPYVSEIQFLMECGNFDHSGNALAISAEAH